jgi:hypothetical protein
MKTGHKIVDAMTPMHFQGVIIDHRWLGHPWLSTKTAGGVIKFNRDAAYVLAEICYFHQARIDRDADGHVTRVSKRFDGQEMYQDYEIWAQRLGFRTKRELADLVSFLKTPNQFRDFGLISFDSRPVRLRSGVWTNNMPHITPIPKYIYEMTFGGGLPKFGDTPPEEQKPDENQGGLPENGDTPDEDDEGGLPENGDTPNPISGHINSNNNSSSPTNDRQTSTTPFVEADETNEAQPVVSFPSSAVVADASESETEEWKPDFEDEDDEDFEEYQRALKTLVAELASMNVLEEEALALIRENGYEAVEAALDVDGAINKMVRELPKDAIVALAPERAAPKPYKPAPLPPSAILPGDLSTPIESPAEAPVRALAVVEPRPMELATPAEISEIDRVNMPGGLYLNLNANNARVFDQMCLIGVDEPAVIKLIEQFGPTYCDYYVRTLPTRNPITPHKILVSSIRGDYDKIRTICVNAVKNQALALLKENAAQIEQRRENERNDRQARIDAENAEFDAVFEQYPAETQTRILQQARAKLGALADRADAAGQLLDARRNVMRELYQQAEAATRRA